MSSRTSEKIDEGNIKMFWVSITGKRLFVGAIVAVAAGAAFCVEIDPRWPVSAQQDRSSNSAFSSPTMPVSSYRSGLIRNPQNSYGVYGNLTVTGNVGGGRHFRGLVPYGSTTELGTLMSDEGSTSLNSFIRRSAGSPYFNSGIGSSTPYYEPMRTVTTLKRGSSSGLSRPEITFQGSSSYTAPSLATIERGANYRTDPLSFIAAELEKKIAAEQLLRQRIRDLDESLLKDDYLSDEVVDREKLAGKLLKIPDSLQPLTPERLKEKLMQEREEKSKSEEPEYLKPDDKEKDSDEGELKERADEVKEQTSKARETVFDYENPYTPKQPDGLEIPEVDPARAASIRGEHKTFKSLAEARYNEYMQAGDDYMKQGKYYLAADSYTLASVWEERDATAYAKRSYALFAAGEYMSSSYWLLKAITLSKEYAGKRINLAGFIGDRDIFENRVIEIGKWLEINESGAMAFLMAYVLYQDGKVSEAKEAIDIAVEQMPEIAAVVSLKEVIEGGGGRE
jgi:hypothetical protein